MLQAAAMLFGFSVLWMMLAPGVSSLADLGAGAAVVLACVACAARFGGLRGGPFARAPQLLVLAARQAGLVLRGALVTVRAALAADVTLNPALVRVKPRPSSEATRAALAGLMSAAPGMAVVDADGDGLLAHVINEDAVVPAYLGELEARVLTARERSAGA